MSISQHPSRRSFLLSAGAMSAFATLRPGRAFAGPFSVTDFKNFVPSDKKLSAEWLASLSIRGKPERYTGKELKWIGMPVGGIACGQLYLGGDGRLWHWDIFRSRYQSDYGTMSMGDHYAHPPEPGKQALRQGFAIRVKMDGVNTTRTLDGNGFKDITFRGEYPVGHVSYRDAALPVDIDLAAFSPFIPLNAKDSALPCTVMEYTVHNTTDHPIEVDLAGWLENAVCPELTNAATGRRKIAIDARGLSCTAHETPQDKNTAGRPDITFADFEGDDYGDWTLEGSAFGKRPFRKDQLASFDQVTGFEGKGLVNTHDTRAAGDNAGKADSFTGTLTSAPFTIERNFIAFRIGGGKHPGKTAIELRIDGKVLRSETGDSSLKMRQAVMDVGDFAGKTASLRIVDSVIGAWGHVAADHIVFTDTRPGPARVLKDEFGFGSMALHALGNQITKVAPLAKQQAPFDALDAENGTAALETGFDERPAAVISQSATLAAGEERKFTFVLSWYFPYYPQVSGEMSPVTDLPSLKRHYAARFEDATAVFTYVRENAKKLIGTTKRWNETWYDSTLPYWLLDRTFIANDCLASTTLHWFDNDRVWAWEGTDCCPGTCQHVWNYAQGMARIFPELERKLREVTDYGIAFRENGALDYRAECARKVAHDGQCGTIMRVWREHTMSPDSGFLRRLWPRVRKSIEFMIGEDKDANGILEGKQYNTLDQAWSGPMGWISSMYLGALAAGAAMADAVGDVSFATQCREIIERGQIHLVADLYDGEYFIHKPNDDFKATNTNKGCHIDQLLGQSWATQFGLPRVVPKKETRSALTSLWKYNFTPDAGDYREKMQSTIKGGRWYAMPGEAGLLMTTWPKGGADKARGSGKAFAIGVGYFNECMNGFEYQVAAHMILEGEPDSDLVEKGLAITRAVHERYAADRRNPYNEIECSDHYSRSMAAYGVFLAACGFEYDGPRGHIGFSPRITPDDFRAPFTTAESWGTFSQKRADRSLSATLEPKYGKLRLNSLALTAKPGQTFIHLDSSHGNATLRQDGQRLLLTLDPGVALSAGEKLELTLTT